MLVLLCVLIVVQVDETDNELKKWIVTIRNLYKAYNKLMFFSISKVLTLYKILTATDFSVNEMMQEIGVLFKNDSEAAKKLKVAVQVIGFIFVCKLHTFVLVLRILGISFWTMKLQCHFQRKHR